MFPPAGKSFLTEINAPQTSPSIRKRVCTGKGSRKALTPSKRQKRRFVKKVLGGNMKYVRAILLGASLMAGASALASAQSVISVQWRGYGDHDRDDGYYNRGYYYYGNNVARRFGYQDGLNDGLNDRRTGHSYRPTHDSSFRHADR